MATIIDVAKLAGVGIGSVSRVINAKDSVSDKTKLKVIKTIQVKDEADIKLYKKYSDADYILHDKPSMEGSIEFPVDLIHKLPKGENFALAGSISESTIESITKLGVKFCDLSSKLETKLGIKDHKIENIEDK